MRKQIIFPFDDDRRIMKKVAIVGEIVGVENINTEALDDTDTPKGIVIHCNKKQWKKIKQQLNLCKVYW